MNHNQFALKLFNTETREKEVIHPAQGETLRMYTCGPTVYNFAHIGNYRAYVFEDLLRRTLKFFGMKVTQVMNITDIEDKIIRGALEKKVSREEFIAPYVQAFFEDLKTLNIEPAEHYPFATDYIADMIKIIQDLIEKGFAYRGQDGSIYFSIEHFPSYGRLSHLHLEELQAGASQRTSSDEYDKEHICDFVLWKAYDAKRDGAIFWESPFGKGRPGWHIECSAMALNILGDTIDIHVGGVDNMFPHHENEIAQSEAYSGKHFVRYWLHCEHLLVNHKKMSKSLGNFYTLRDLLKLGYEGIEVRYLLLQTHYRTQLNFTMQGLEGACSALTRWTDFVNRLEAITEKKSSGLIEPLLQSTLEKFSKAMADDLNISVALSVLFDLLHEVHQLCDENKVSQDQAQLILKFLQQIDTVLGVLPLEKEELEIPELLQEALAKREQARAQKNWQEADRQRDFILSQGYLIEDTLHGARLKKKR